MKTVRLRIEGRVQGVWFRAWTRSEAGSLGLDGWVRNCRDGSLEALLSGPDDAVDRMVERCRQGPPAAHVTSITESPADPPDRAGFHVLDSG